MAGDDLGEGTRLAAATGAWIVFEDEADLTPGLLMTRKRSLVQIQYCPPGISCSWPYKVAFCSPTTALQRALLGPSSAQVPARELAVDLGAPMDPSA